MTVEEHTQQLIGMLGFQLVQKSATIDAQAAEIERLKQFEPKPEPPAETTETKP